LKCQPDLFATTADINQAPALDPASMERMTRPRLSALLEEARQADSLPWDEQRTRVNALLFHNMANWLPVSERDSLRAAFVRELERLGGIEPRPAADNAEPAAPHNASQN
jgi:hypothetical protein